MTTAAINAREKPFQIVSEFSPMGDQPAAIDGLTERLEAGQKFNTLLGATGTGKTFTMAHTIARVQKPTLVISHNKTLAAQLYEEFKELLPNNAVSYFVSYYDYYQPEAYIPQRDIYVEKDSSRNDDLDRLRMAATTSLVSRRDVVVVASVSCIFGLGSPMEYKKVGDPAGEGRHDPAAGFPAQPRRGAVHPQRVRAEARRVQGAGRRDRGRARGRGVRVPHRALRRRDREPCS